MSDGAPLMIGSTACFGRQHEEIYKMDTKPSLDAEGLARTRYPRGADCIQVSAGRWITLDVATHIMWYPRFQLCLFSWRE